jgi:hypothetical protein
MLDLIELFTHWHAGRSQVQLSESLGIDRKTVVYAEIGITRVMPHRSLCRIGVLGVRPNW